MIFAQRDYGREVMETLFVHQHAHPSIVIHNSPAEMFFLIFVEITTFMASVGGVERRINQLFSSVELFFSLIRVRDEKCLINADENILYTL